MSSQKPYSRTVQDVGNGCLGVSIPKGLAEQHDLEPGDEVSVERDGAEVTFKLAE